MKKKIVLSILIASITSLLSLEGFSIETSSSRVRMENKPSFEATVPHSIYDEDSSSEDVRVGKQVSVFAENASVYVSPSEKSTKAGSLPIGAKATILARLKENGSRNGLKNAWLKTSIIAHGQPLTGYIWGGDLAIGSVQIDEKTLFLAGLTGMKTPTDPESYEKLAEARIVKDGKIVSRTSFEPVDSLLANEKNVYSYEVKAEKWKKEGFSPALALVALNFKYEACDFPNGDLIFTWNGKQVTVGPTVTVTNSADYVASVSYNYIWPKDPGGSRNCLIVENIITPGEAELDETGKMKQPSKTIQYYAWDGEKLGEAKQCPK